MHINSTQTEPHQVQGKLAHLPLFEPGWNDFVLLIYRQSELKKTYRF